MLEVGYVGHSQLVNMLCCWFDEYSDTQEKDHGNVDK